MKSLPLLALLLLPAARARAVDRSTAPAGVQTGRPGATPSRTDRTNTLDWLLFGEGQQGGGRQKESTWLEMTQYAAHKSGCYNEDKPACRANVAKAREQILANLREGGDIAGKKFKDYYRAAIAKRGDPRATDINALFYLILGDEYGTKNRPHEVMLTTAEKQALSAASAGAVTANKSGSALLAEYDTELSKLETADHVARHLLTEKYRKEVPAASRHGAPPASRPGSAPANPDRLSDEELKRLRELSPERAADYEKAMLPTSNEASRRIAVQAARDWLADRPTEAEFAAVTDEAAIRRVCDKMSQERSSSPASTSSLTTVKKSSAQLVSAKNGNASGMIAGAVGPEKTPVDSAARSSSGYQWPAGIIAKCERLRPGASSPPPGDSKEPPSPARDESGASPSNTPPGTDKPVGIPKEKEGAGKTPLTEYNHLLKGAMGAAAGAIVGFALGGPVGMFVGAAVFGVTAWGLSRIGDA